MILDINEKRKRKAELGFPDLISEGKRYGLSNQQIANLTRYLNDRRLLSAIRLEKFRHNAGAWLAALTGIVADILAIDAHVSIWMNKKLEKPRNWILSKINAVIPTQIDDIVMKAIDTAQHFTDETLLPLKERVFSKISSKMHDRYQYHENANALGLTLKEQEVLQKERLKESEPKGKDAINTLRKRQLMRLATGGLYKDNEGNFHRITDYKQNPYLTKLENKRLSQINERIKIKNENTKTQEILEKSNSKEGDFP